MRTTTWHIGIKRFDRWSCHRYVWTIQWNVELFLTTDENDIIVRHFQIWPIPLRTFQTGEIVNKFFKTKETSLCIFPQFAILFFQRSRFPYRDPLIIFCLRRCWPFYFSPWKTWSMPFYSSKEKRRRNSLDQT